MEKLIEWDQQLFLFLHPLGHPELNGIMLFITHKLSWIPLYVLLIVVLFRLYRKKVVWIILAIVLGITLSDQLTSSVMKPGFARLRPCYELGVMEEVEAIAGCGGRFGFASSHASNSFTVAALIAPLLMGYWRYAWLLYLWAAIVSYSRIYVGVHYPADVLVGALLGILIGTGCYFLAQWLSKHFA